MFEKLLSAHVEIKGRLEISNSGAFVSNRFLLELYHILTLDCDHHMLLDALHNLLSTYKDELEKIRWELARTPTKLIVVKYSRQLYSGRSEEFIGLQTRDGSYRFSIGTAYCPDYVPDLDKESDGDTVWCLCTQEQARNLRGVITSCWNETDSLVDWITAILDPPQKDKDTDQLPVSQQSSIETDQLPDTQQTPKQLIYDYIQTNAPVKTAQILSQEFAGRSRTFALLKELEREDKIQKESHGFYNTV